MLTILILAITLYGVLLSQTLTTVKTSLATLVYEIISLTLSTVLLIVVLQVIKGVV